MSDCLPKASRQAGRAAAAGKAASRRATARAEELGRSVQALRDEVRALGRRLDDWCDGQAARGWAPDAVSVLASGGAPVPPGNGRAELHSPPCPLRELSLLAPDGAGSPRVLPSLEPFEVRLALGRSGAVHDMAFPVVCQVSARARRLGGHDEGSIILGESSQTIASASEPARLRCEGLPVAGLYRVEATAAVRVPGETRATAMAYLGGSLVRAV